MCKLKAQHQEDVVAGDVAAINSNASRMHLCLGDVSFRQELQQESREFVEYLCFVSE